MKLILKNNNILFFYKLIATILIFTTTQILMGTTFPSEITINEYTVQHLDIKDGLSHNSVTSLHKDKRGFLWVGTYDGINRYNGYEFEVFRNQPKDSTTLINNRIVSIYSNRNEVWVGTKRGVSVYSYLTGKFTSRYRIDPLTKKRIILDAPINAIDGNGGRTYIATAGNGLLYNTSQKKNLQPIPLRIGNEILWNYHAQAIETDKEGVMWVFIQGQGIAVLNSEKEELQLIFSGIKSGSSLTFDDESNLWVGMDNGVLRYNIESKYYEIFSQRNIRHPIKDLVYLPEKNQVWAATDGNGIVKYDFKERKFSELEEGYGGKKISNKSVFALLRDDDRLWVGSRDGLDLLLDEMSPFTTVSKTNSNNSLPSNLVLSFAEQNINKIWIGTDGYGVSLWNRAENDFSNFAHDPKDPSSLSNDFVTSIVTNDKGVWMGTYGGGINLFDEEKGEFKKYELYNKKYKNYQNNVWVLFIDRDDQLWAGTSDREGLFKYNLILDEFEYVETNLNGIISMSQDEKGNFWVGRFGELVKLDLENLDHKVFDMEFPVRSIIFDSNDNLFLGTEGGGLIHLDPKTNQKEVFTEVDGLPNNSVLNILRDNKGKLWMSTYNGISKFNPDTEEISNFSDADGLQSNQFNYNAALELSNGKLLMGGIKGFNIINPEFQNSPHSFPELVISGIKINNVPLSNSEKTAFATSELELPYDKSMLSIKFAALEYNLSEKISYAYILEGWDREWHYVGNSRVANYSKLPEGNYTFKIKSTNGDGIWNEEVTSLSIVIYPPWFRTTIAYFIYFILGIGIFYGFFLYYRNQERMKYEVHLSREKIKQEKDLNEKKLNFFTNIAHEFRSPLTMIINPLKDMIYGKNSKMDGGEIEIIYQNSRRLLSLVDQLLLFRKTDSDTGNLKIVHLDLVHLCKEVFTCFMQHASSRNINYNFQSEEKEVFIFADRQKIEMSLFNLISNALKFTQKNEGKVFVKLSCSDNEILLQVVDNGEGISAKEKEKIFGLFYQADTKNRINRNGFGIGLYLVNSFIKKHNGSVTCFDNEYGGTTFEIKLKQGKNHFKDSIIHEELEETHMISESLLVEERDDNSGKDLIEREGVIQDFAEKNQTILIIDDNPQILAYLVKILSETYKIVKAESAEEGMETLNRCIPDLIVSDVVMQEMSGVEFCKTIKTSTNFKHIPVILLTAGSSEEIKLKGVEVGADDYITKPFNKEYLKARIKGILKRRETIKNHFLNNVTKNIADQKISQEDKELLDKIVEAVEARIEEEEEEGFNLKDVATEIGMSHSLMYKRIKQITGKSASEFVRFIRLRKVATLLIISGMRVSQAASMAGFRDLKYFRKQFQKQYEMNPSEFQKKYKNVRDKNYILNETFWKSDQVK